MASERQFLHPYPDRRRPLPQWHRAWLFLAVLLIFLGEALADQSPFPIPDASKRPVRTSSDSAKTVVDLQPFRRSHTIAIKGRGGQSGTATLIELNPVINTWFVLTLDWGGAGPQSRHHLENPDPHNQYLQLTGTAPDGLIISDGGKRPCDLWAGDVTALQRAASSPLPYAPLCDGRLLLRNRVSGHYTGLERTAEIFRDYVWHGEAIVGFVRRSFFTDAYIEKPGSQMPDGSAETGPELPIAPRPAQVKPAAAGLEVAPGTMGIAAEGAKEGRFISGRWYPATGLPSIYVSVIQPMLVAEPILNSYRDRVNPLDPAEASALDYLVAFDLTKFDLGFSVSTEQGPSREWGSGSHSRFGAGIGFEELSEAGAEFAVEDGAADLEQEISTASGPAHLLLLVHASVDQEVGSTFDDRGADPQAGAMTLGVVDQPSTLAGQIAVDLAQRRPQSA